MKDNKSIEVFSELVKAGLWEKEVRLESYKEINWQAIYQQALEQGVLGLVMAALEKADAKPPQVLLLQMIGEVQMIEQRNKTMNQLIADVIEKMQSEGLNPLLVKGQGVAQCYERPLWRPSGDIDFFLGAYDYNRAVIFFQSWFQKSKCGGSYSKEYAFYTDDWMIEVHGGLRTCLSTRVDREIDDVQKDTFENDHVRTWHNGDIDIPLPNADNDVFFVFTHFIKHFYKEEMNLRQLCDWCRLLWTYRDSLNHELLEKRIRKAGLMKEWKAFAALAVEYLGMPSEAMPLYDARGKMSGGKFSKKAELILKHILKGEPYNKVRDTWEIAKIFPWNTFKFAPAIFLNVNGLKIKERLFN